MIIVDHYLVYEYPYNLLIVFSKLAKESFYETTNPFNFSLTNSTYAEAVVTPNIATNPTTTSAARIFKDTPCEAITAITQL